MKDKSHLVSVETTTTATKLHLDLSGGHFEVEQQWVPVVVHDKEPWASSLIASK